MEVSPCGQGEEKNDVEICNPDGEDIEYEYDHDDTTLSYVLQQTILAPKAEDPSQRHQLFWTVEDCLDLVIKLCAVFCMRLWGSWQAGGTLVILVISGGQIR